jgi:type I restriction enzyme R subunit
VADAREPQFQRDVVAYLAAHGWSVGTSSAFDKELALYPEDILGFYQEAFPGEWQRFRARYPQNTEKALLKSVANQLGKDGTLSVLRHGYKDRGATVRLAQFRPDHNLNPETVARYTLNRLRVVPELVYSPNSYDGRIDLTLFVNGLPTATLELKSEFKQAVDEAKKQYQTERLPEDPVTRRPEPLLSFKRGALVYFAVSQEEVWMSTKLAGIRTSFLPFNLGTPMGVRATPSTKTAMTPHTYGKRSWHRTTGSGYWAVLFTSRKKRWRTPQAKSRSRRP